MAAACAGATLGTACSSFADNTGGPPRTGQFFIAIAPGPFSAGGFAERAGALAEALTAEAGTRLPGRRRMDARARIADSGVTIGRALHERLLGYCA